MFSNTGAKYPLGIYVTVKTWKTEKKRGALLDDIYFFLFQILILQLLLYNFDFSHFFYKKKLTVRKKWKKNRNETENERALKIIAYQT